MPQRVVDRFVEHKHQEAIIAIKLPAALQRDLAILAEIHSKIMPSGFVDARIDGFHRHHLDFLVEALEVAVSVSVEIIVAPHVTVDEIFGNIEPEPKCTSVLKRRYTVFGAKSDICILLGIRILGMQSVGLQTQRIIAVMHLTVGSVSQRQIQIIIPVRSVSVIDNIPLVNVALAILEVPQNHRAPAKLQRKRCCGTASQIQRCGHGCSRLCGCILLVNSCEVESTKAAKRIVHHRKGDAVRIDTDFNQPIIDRCFNRDFHRFAKGNGNDLLIERNRVRDYHLNGVFTDDAAVIQQLGSHSAFRSVGSKDTVFINLAHTFFFDCPYSVLRDVNLGANSVKAGSVKANGAAGSIIIIVCADGRMGKLTVRRSGRNNDKGVGRRSLAAVRHTAVDLEILAGALRAERGGAASVAVRGNDAAHLDHVIRHLIAGKACGERSHFAVAHDQHKCAVSFHADEGSCGNTAAVILCSITFCILVHRIAVCIRLNEICKQNRNGLLFPASQRIGRIADPDLRHIGRTLLSGDRMLVIIDDNNRLNAAGRKCSVRSAAVLIEPAVED